MYVYVWYGYSIPIPRYRYVYVHILFVTKTLLLPCFFIDIRLSGSNYSNRGSLEIFHNAEWRAICGSNSNTSAIAEVACRQLGFPGMVKPSLLYTLYGISSKNYLARLRCIGTENTISSCYRSHWSKLSNSCPAKVIVTCRAGRY